MERPIPDNLVHAMSHCHRQWIPADERGFRSRGHRIHSTGDYKNPPPVAEHEGLRRHVRSIMTGAPVRLHAEQRVVVGAAIVFKLQNMGCTVLIISCGPTHTHAMFAPTEVDVVKQFGKAKQYASLKCPDHHGQLWGESADVESVDGLAHARRLFGYINSHKDQEGAWVWRFDRDAPPLKPGKTVRGR